MEFYLSGWQTKRITSVIAWSKEPLFAILGDAPTCPGATCTRPWERDGAYRSYLHTAKAAVSRRTMKCMAFLFLNLRKTRQS